MTTKTKEIQAMLVSGYSTPGEGRIVRHSIYNTYKKMKIVGAYMQLCCEGAAGLSDMDYLMTKGAGSNPWTTPVVATPESPTAGQLLETHIQGATNSNVAYAEFDLPEGCTIDIDIGETLSWITWDNGAVKTQFACMIYFYYE